MSEQIVHLTDASFEQEVLQSDVPVVVDYWAEWCGPCKMIGPILEELAVEYGDKVKIAKINIDENAQTPPKFGIRSIPTLMVFKGGEVEGTKVGAASKSDFDAAPTFVPSTSPPLNTISVGMLRIPNFGGV